MTRIVIIGAGGFAREALDVIEACAVEGTNIEMAGFVVDRQFGEAGQMVNDAHILGDFEWLEQHTREFSVVCAVGAPEKKRTLVERARAIGCRFMTIIHPSVIRTRWTALGEGVVITAGCVLSNRITIGDHVHLNPGCIIGHDVEIGSYASVAPGAHISGNVIISEGVYIGTGANVIEKITIGEWTIIGAGSTVIRDIPANTTAVGMPAMVIKERMPGWHQAPSA